MSSFEDAKNEEEFLHQNAHYASQSMPRGSYSTALDSTMPASKRLQIMKQKKMIQEKEHMQEDIPISSFTDQVKKSTQIVGAIGDFEKGRGQLRPFCSSDVSKNEDGSFNQNTHLASQSMSTPIIFSTKGLRTSKKKRSVPEKEHVQADILIFPSTDQVMQSTQSVGTSSKISEKIKKGRGSNKCKEVTSLEVGQKLKVIFYNNRTVGKNNNLFSRHLGRIVRDRNMCSLAVSSWADFKEEKLNHIWAAVKDKFESDDMNIHRDHVLGWMKELWNKWRGQLHEKYVKGKPIQEALKNIPKGVDKNQWEWLLKEHFSTEKFQLRSNRNATNRAKLKMLHRIGSKPIREIIYQKGGKDGNPPDFETIFFETQKKNNTLLDSKTIEKHAQIQEVVQSEPSLSNIKIVEKCFGPQTRSHVFGFGGGVKRKDLKCGTTSKAEL